MSSKMQAQLVSHLFKLMIEQQHGLEILHFLHGDCLEKGSKGILTLYSAGKENIVYKLANVIAERRMDLERMPFGLIDYNIRFFDAENVVKLKMEEHYAIWQETMFAHFGHKWVSLNRGPMWQYDEDEELKESQKLPNCDILAEALNSAGIVDTDNVPAVDSTELGQVVASMFEEEGDDTCSTSEEYLVDGLYSADTREKASSLCEIPKVCDSECEANVIEEDAVEGFDASSVVQTAEHGEVLSNDLFAEVGSEGEELASVSTLWTSITREEVNEIIESNANPLLFERLHGVVPQNHSTTMHSGLYKPEKVCVRST